MAASARDLGGMITGWGLRRVENVMFSGGGVIEAAIGGQGRDGLGILGQSDVGIFVRVRASANDSPY